MKIKVFELEFDASNLHEVAFAKEVIAGSSLNVPATGDVIVPAQEEKPVEVEETEYTPQPDMPAKPKRKKAEAPAPEPAPAPVPEPEPEPAETVHGNDAPNAKEMQDLVISLIKTGKLSREDVQTIFNEFGGTSLMKIAPAKFALLKQRLTTYNND